MAKVIDFDDWKAPTGEALSLSGRIMNCFLHANIRTIEQLTNCSEADLLQIPQFGKNSLDIVKRELAKHKLTLKGTRAHADRLEYHSDEPLQVTYDRAFAEGRKVGFTEGFKAHRDSVNRALNRITVITEEVRLGTLPTTEDRPVDKIGLSTRTQNYLKREGIDTIGQLVEYSEERLMQIQGFGETGRHQVVQALLHYGLTLKEDMSKMHPNFQGNDYDDPREEQ